MLYIYNAKLVTPDKVLDDHALVLEGNRIIKMGPTVNVTCPPAAKVIDAAGLWVTPGLIDLQLNGAFGHDFTANPETIWAVAQGLPQYGITSFLPTIITSPLETVAAAQTVVTQSPETDWQGAIPLGLHVEGPFLNPAKKGAHNPAHLRLPTLEVVADWSPSQGVQLVTMAPELSGALPVIEALVSHGVVVSAGHSMATYAEAQTGFEAGIRYGTHFFNAMPSLHHREPGLPGALLMKAELTVGLIPDGIHVHPSLVNLIWRTKGANQLNLVSDAMAALGMSPGQYQIGDQAVTVTKNDARLTDGTLAGSILAPDQAVRNLMAYTDCSFSEAITTITKTPATLLNISSDRGQLLAGSLADVVLWSAEFEVVMTMVEGKIVFQNESWP